MCVLSVRFKRIDGVKMLRFISAEIYGAVRVGKTRTALYKRIPPFDCILFRAMFFFFSTECSRFDPAVELS